MPKSEASLRVLIADDSNSFRRELRAFLEGAGGIEIIGEAEDGMQAVEMAEKLRPDAVLMDQNMPMISGIEATELIISARPDSRVLFLAGEENWRQQALEVGAEAYFVKVAGMDDMLRELRKGDHQAAMMDKSDDQAAGNEQPAASSAS
jgi:DNA-binding NarL/FixJ family response regulator